MVTVYADVETGGVLPQHPTIQLGAVAIDGNGDELSFFTERIAFTQAGHLRRDLRAGKPMTVAAGCGASMHGKLSLRVTASSSVTRRTTGEE